MLQSMTDITLSFRKYEKVYCVHFFVGYIVWAVPWQNLLIRYANNKPEDHWSCIAHLSAEDMLKSAVEEKKF